MAKGNKPAAQDLATLSPEELLAWAQAAQAKIAEQEQALQEGIEKIEKLEINLKTLQEDAEKFEKDLEEALAENTKLQIKLEDAPTKGSNPTVTHGGKKYSVTIPSFRYKGVAYNAESLAKDKELVAELIKISSEVLKPV